MPEKMSCRKVPRVIRYKEEYNWGKMKLWKRSFKAFTNSWRAFRAAA